MSIPTEHSWVIQSAPRGNEGAPERPLIIRRGAGRDG
jgi:hypothetical protein